MLTLYEETLLTTQVNNITNCLKLKTKPSKECFFLLYKRQTSRESSSLLTSLELLIIDVKLQLGEIGKFKIFNYIVAS